MGMEQSQQKNSQTYEVCCFNYKRMKIPIFGNFPPNGRIELDNPYIISLRQVDYDRLRGLTQNGEPAILNSERKIGENNGMVHFKLAGREYVHLASWGEISTKTQKPIQSSTSPIVEDYQRFRISDAVKERLKKGKNRSRYEVSGTFSEIAGEISSGCCIIKDFPKRHRIKEIRDTIRDYVIMGAKILGQRPGKVMPTKEGGIQLDKSAINQFKKSYQAIKI